MVGTVFYADSNGMFFFREMKNENVNSSSKLIFPIYICEEIQTLFFADGSEVVRLG